MDPDDDNDDDLKQPMIHPGEIGTILLAAVFLFGFWFVMFGPNPLELLVKAAQSRQQAPSGEVTVTLPQKH